MTLNFKLSFLRGFRRTQTLSCRQGRHSSYLKCHAAEQSEAQASSAYLFSCYPEKSFFLCHSDLFLSFWSFSVILRDESPEESKGDPSLRSEWQKRNRHSARTSPIMSCRRTKWGSGIFHCFNIMEDRWPRSLHSLRRWQLFVIRRYDSFLSSWVQRRIPPPTRPSPCCGNIIPKPPQNLIKI